MKKQLEKRIGDQKFLRLMNALYKYLFIEYPNTKNSPRPCCACRMFADRLQVKEENCSIYTQDILVARKLRNIIQNIIIYYEIDLPIKRYMENNKNLIYIRYHTEMLFIIPMQIKNNWRSKNKFNLQQISIEDNQGIVEDIEQPWRAIINKIESIQKDNHRKNQGNPIKNEKDCVSPKTCIEYLKYQIQIKNEQTTTDFSQIKKEKEKQKMGSILLKAPIHIIIKHFQEIHLMKTKIKVTDIPNLSKMSQMQIIK